MECYYLRYNLYNCLCGAANYFAKKFEYETNVSASIVGSDSSIGKIFATDAINLKFPSGCFEMKWDKCQFGWYIYQSFWFSWETLNWFHFMNWIINNIKPNTIFKFIYERIYLIYGILKSLNIKFINWIAYFRNFEVK